MYALRVFLAYKAAFANAAPLPMAERHAARAAALDTMMRLVPMAQECDRLITDSVVIGTASRTISLSV
jgi:hypothetical protein